MQVLNFGGWLLTIRTDKLPKIVGKNPETGVVITANTLREATDAIYIHEIPMISLQDIETITSNYLIDRPEIHIRGRSVSIFIEGIRSSVASYITTDLKSRGARMCDTVIHHEDDCTSIYASF